MSPRTTSPTPSRPRAAVTPLTDPQPRPRSPRQPRSSRYPRSATNTPGSPTLQHENDCPTKHSSPKSSPPNATTATPAAGSAGYSKPASPAPNASRTSTRAASPTCPRPPWPNSPPARGSTPANRSCSSGTPAPAKPTSSSPWAPSPPKQGRRVRYVTTAALANELAEAADDKRLSRLVARYATLDLLALDEVGYVSLDPRGAELLFQIITAREERASIACASNAPFSEWGTTFTDPRLAAAVVDSPQNRGGIDYKESHAGEAEEV